MAPKCPQEKDYILQRSTEGSPPLTWAHSPLSLSCLTSLPHPHVLSALMRLSSKGSAAQGAATWTCYRILCSFKDFIQSGQPFLSLTIRIRAVFLGTECVAFRPWSGWAGTLRASFGIEDGCKLPQLTWKGVTQHTISPRTPKIFSEWWVPECSKYLSLTLWSACVLPCMLAPSCSSCLIDMAPPMWWISVMFCGMSTCSRALWL